jgi:hypothetical protein
MRAEYLTYRAGWGEPDVWRRGYPGLNAKARCLADPLDRAVFKAETGSPGPVTVG